MWPAQLLSWWRYKRNTESFDLVDLCWTLGVLPVPFYRWRAKIWVQWRKGVQWLELISRSPSFTMHIWSTEQAHEICTASIVDCVSIWTVDSLLRGVDGLISEQKVKVPVDHCDTRVRTVCGDVMQMSAAALASLSPSGRGYSVLVSDMCPSVSGIGSKDAALSAELGMCALHLALGQSEADSSISLTGGILLPGGSLVIKLLEGEESQGFLKLCKGRFQQLSWLRPKATRSASREIYLIGKGKVNIKHPCA